MRLQNSLDPEAIKKLPKFIFALLVLASGIVIQKVALGDTLGTVIAFLFPLPALFAYFLYKKELLSKDMAIVIVALFLSSLILFFGLEMMSVANGVDYSRQYNFRTYNLWTESFPTSNISLADFSFSSNVGKEQTQLNFTILKSELDKIQKIRIHFPENLVASSIDIVGDNNKNLNRETNYRTLIVNGSNGTDSFLELSDFNVSQNNAVYVTIDFNGSLHPPGKYIFNIDFSKIYFTPERPTISFNNLTMFVCSTPCFGNIQNSVIQKEGNDLNVYYPDYYNNLDSSPYKQIYQAFVVNMFDTNSQQIIDTYRAIGSGVIVSAVFLYVEYLIKFLNIII